MYRIDGTAARQLDLFTPDDPSGLPVPRDSRRPQLKLLRKDVYAELTRRRRRAQIAARHALRSEDSGRS
jgi:hypothetical protein